MGGIGRNLKQKMDVFGMTTIYHNRKRLDPEQAAGAEYVSFDELLAKSDVLSLNLPLSVSLSLRSSINRKLTKLTAAHETHHLHQRV